MTLSGTSPQTNYPSLLHSSPPLPLLSHSSPLPLPYSLSVSLFILQKNFSLFVGLPLSYFR